MKKNSWMMCRNVGSFGQKKVKLKRDFFLLSLKHCCERAFVVVQHFTIFCTAFIFLAICSLSTANSLSSTFDEENSWKMIESSIKRRWFIGIFFLVGAIDSSKFWRRWNIRWPVAGLKIMLLGIMRRWESVSSFLFISGSKNCHCPIFHSCQNLKF